MYRDSSARVIEKRPSAKLISVVLGANNLLDVDVHCHTVSRHCWKGLQGQWSKVKIIVINLRTVTYYTVSQKTSPTLLAITREIIDGFL